MEIYEACEYYMQQLEAAKQQNLELLAVIAQAKHLFAEINHAIFTMPPIRIGDSTIVDEVDIFLTSNFDPSQALREHEAKVLDQATYELDDLFTAFGGERSDTIAKCQSVLRRMAEERRKK